MSKVCTSFNGPLRRALSDERARRGGGMSGWFSDVTDSVELLVALAEHSIEVGQKARMAKV